MEKLDTASQTKGSIMNDVIFRRTKMLPQNKKVKAICFYVEKQKSLPLQEVMFEQSRVIAEMGKVIMMRLFEALVMEEGNENVVIVAKKLFGEMFHETIDKTNNIYKEYSKKTNEYISSGWPNAAKMETVNNQKVKRKCFYWSLDNENIIEFLNIDDKEVLFGFLNGKWRSSTKTSYDSKENNYGFSNIFVKEEKM